MSRAKLNNLSIEQLVQQFTDLAVQQDMALLGGPQKEVNRIFWKLEAIESELKGRPGDQRAALLPLYNHKNKQVQVKAAKATLAIAPEAARSQLEAIRVSGWQPQALEAGMCLWNLERGVFKPT
jgi:cytochrome c oxidase assembly protein Cox11